MRLAKLKDAAPSTAPIEQLISRMEDRFLAMVRRVGPDSRARPAEGALGFI
jgi:hypothetical protein